MSGARHVLPIELCARGRAVAQGRNSIGPECATGRTSFPAALLATFLLAWPAAAGCSPPASDSTTCSWKVVGEGMAQPGDVDFADRDPLLRDSQSNTVPGPNGSCAIVKSGAAHHPSIFIESPGHPLRLLRSMASRPKWSPQGKHIACMVSRSARLPWELSVIEVASGRHWDPEAPCHAMNYAWSPRGDAIAFEGPGHAGQHRLLCVISWPSLRVTVLDSIPVSSNFHFSWSPDSRWLVLDRATRLDSEEDVTASDLWLISRTGVRCQLTNTPAFVETEPHWVNGRRIQFLRTRMTDDDPVEESRSLDVLEAGNRLRGTRGPS